MHRGMGNLLGTIISVSTLLVAGVDAAGAQADNSFGLQQRADAASNMIVLGVQQGISSLPPTSGQAFTYDFNDELGTFVESEQLGPTVLRSTQTIGANRLSLRFATSYFELGETFDPIVYQATGGPIPPGQQVYTSFGMSADANVVLFNLAATYGFTDRIEATINIPFSVVDARASQTFLTFPPPFPPAKDARVAAVPGDSPAIVQQALDAGVVAERELSFSALGADFNSGKQVGLGRISVGVKGLVLASDWVDVAASGEFFCNSPSQDEFAGSDSPSILPRVIAQLKAAKHLNVFTDVGYEYDFDVDQLSRFVWNAGISIPVVNATFDFGAGGSLFDESLTWTPVQATGGEGVTIRAVNPSATELGTNYVDFLAGVKVGLFEGAVLSGSVNVPVTDDGFRAAAIGTVSLEYYFKTL
ncbi:MAG: hypothetical protein ACRERC_14585 [Candidatus Binatia bacterium]